MLQLPGKLLLFTAQQKQVQFEQSSFRMEVAHSSDLADEQDEEEEEDTFEGVSHLRIVQNANEQDQHHVAPPRASRQPKQSMSKTKLKKLLREEQDRERKHTVVQSFHNFYHRLYGDRWPPLHSALQSKPRMACLQNKYADFQAFAQNVAGVPGLACMPFFNLPLYESSDRFPHPERDDRNLHTSYMLDAASVLAAEALEVEPQDNVLDLCAAPGGKSLAILQRLELPKGSLTANEVSAERRRRLWKVIVDYVPENLRHCVSVTGRDGTHWFQSELYDKVLVDAPCSAERHLLQNQEELHKWTEQRTVNCAKRQLALLNNALKSVRVGGLVVYSTCSISHEENDNVIGKTLKKGKVDCEVLQKQWLFGEKTDYGWIVLPDAEGGWGPLYFSVLRRVESSSG